MRKQKAGMKKALAAFLGLAVVGSYVPSIPAAAADPEPEPILNFDFEGLTAGQDIVTDTAKASGGYTLTDSYDGSGKALHLDGTSSQWLDVTKADETSLLTGVEEMTVSYDIKNERTGTNWAFYAAPNRNTQENTVEHYIGFLHNNGNLTVERYNNTNGRPVSPTAATGNDWVHIDAVLSETDTAIYVNGVEKSRAESNYLLPDILGESSILQIGKANWAQGEYTQAAIDNLKVYDQALTAEQLRQQIPEVFLELSLDEIAESITPVTLENGQNVLPDYNETVKWTSTDLNQIVISEDGLIAEVEAPGVGEEDVTGTIYGVITLGTLTQEIQTSVTVKAQIDPNTPYGYLMVHFVEDSAGYAEKMYLDISRGDNPEQWDPLNDRKPILASNLGTTGSRDPYLTYNPETKTYYIIATDLRVFNANDSEWNNGNWGVWSSQGSTKMNVWESKDLITWSDVRQFDVTLNQDGTKAAELGMMWAPEATWVDDYYGEGKGAFVVYWSSNVYADASHTSVVGGGSDIMWGVTTDFTQDTWEYGGMMLDGGTAGWIDTNILQNDGKTYHITKSNAEEIIMEVSTAKHWWKLDEANWKRVQSHIGQSRFGAVEGPATFTDHSQSDRWYLFVDDLPTPGYQPMVSTNLDEGWDYLDSPNYFLTSYTKHGGVISLTKAQYDALRSADAESAVNEDLGTVEIETGSTEEALAAKMPETAQVKLYSGGTSELPVVWDLSAVDRSTAGNYTVTGTVQSLSANTDAWVGDNGSELHTAPNKTLYSSNAITVNATVTVKEKAEPEKVLTDITITSGPDKTTYVQGDALDLTGLVVEAMYSDSTTETLSAGEGGYTVTGYDPQKIGRQTVTVTYQDKSKQFTVTVEEKRTPVDPSDPGDPTQPAGPDDTKKPSDTQNPGQNTVKDEEKPVQTGDSTNLFLPAAGMAAAVILIMAAKRRMSR